MKLSVAWFYMLSALCSMIAFLTVMWLINPVIVGLLFIASAVYCGYEISRAKVIKNEK